jgi:hypothetical protein
MKGFKGSRSNAMPTSALARSGVWVAELLALVALCFIYAGDPPPAVNEAHYLVKAKNFWDPSWCAEDLFVSSGKAHTTFYWTFGWLTRLVSLEATAWIGRVVGWSMLACGLIRCCRAIKLPPFSSLGVAVLWITGVERGNFAGEWIVGGIEAKVPAYGLALCGFADAARRQWATTWIWLGAASAFHVLTGGWAVIASAIAFLVTERPWKSSDLRKHRPRRVKSPLNLKFFAGLVIGGAIASLGVIPALLLTMNATAEQSTAAARIYSYLRISHHLLPANFPSEWFIRHAALMMMLYLIVCFAPLGGRLRRLVWICVGANLIALIGLAVGLVPSVAPDLGAKLLRYYWFRLGDALVPLGIAFWAMHAIAHRRGGTASTRWLRTASAWGLLIYAGFAFIDSTWSRHRVGIPPSTSHRLLGFAPNASVRAQRQSHSDWVAVCNWARVATPADEVFLTPRHQQTFKWYAERAEVVNWKDVPQDAKSLVEWKRRFYRVFPRELGRMRVSIRYDTLRGFRDEYNVRFMIVDNRVAGNQLPLVKIYPLEQQDNQTYSVYELPAD